MVYYTQKKWLAIRKIYLCTQRVSILDFSKSYRRFTFSDCLKYKTNPIDARTTLYYNSFVPSTVRVWNNVNDEVKQSDSLNTFKGFLSKDKLLVPKHFYVGHRKVQV